MATISAQWMRLPAAFPTWPAPTGPIAADEQVEGAALGAADAAGERHVEQVDAAFGGRAGQTPAGFRPHRRADRDHLSGPWVRGGEQVGHHRGHVVVGRDHDQDQVGRVEPADPAYARKRDVGIEAQHRKAVPGQSRGDGPAHRAQAGHADHRAAHDSTFSSRG
jgi:hypothetical protein